MDGRHAAIRIYLVNAQLFPKSATVWNSLGEAYAATGERKKAMQA